jgi:hypothetical protein
VSLSLRKNIMSHPKSPPRTVPNRWTCTQSSQSGRILHHFHRPTFSGWTFLFRGVGRVEKNVESSSDCVPPKLMLSMMSISSPDSFRPHCRGRDDRFSPRAFQPPRPVQSITGLAAAHSEGTAKNTKMSINSVSNQQTGGEQQEAKWR